MGTADIPADIRFGGHLIIDSATNDRDAINVTFVDEDGSVSGPASMSLPLHELGLTGLSEALTRDNLSGVATSARAYGQILRRHLRAALEGVEIPEGASADAFGTDALPLLVSVVGPPRVHQVMWEAIDADELPTGGHGALVVHLPWLAGTSHYGMADRRRTHLAGEAVGQARLRWIGARPFVVDLPRYLIAGPVAHRVLSSDRLSFDVLRTNATADEARALLPRNAAEPLITHLDVHGTNRMRAGEHAGLIAEPEFAAFFREGESVRKITDQTIAEAVKASGCLLFVTNACFGAQQREIGQWPLPARLVHGGCRAAIAAKDPLDGNAAMLFFTWFYGALAQGAPIGRAYAEARQLLTTHPHGQESGPGGDLSSRYALQPVLWASSVDDLAVRLLPLHEPAAEGGEARPGSGLAPYVELARLDEDFAQFVATIEDLYWSGTPKAQLTVDGKSDLDGEEAVAAVTDVVHMFGTRVAVVAEPAEETHLWVFPGFTNRERYLMVSLRFIDEPNPLRELLGLAVHTEARYLDYLESTSKRDVARALLLGLSWGDVNAPTVALSAGLQSADQILDAACQRVVREQGDPEEFCQTLADANRAAYALPLTVTDDQFMNVSAPRLAVLRPEYAEELTKNGALTVLQYKEQRALAMRRRDQVAMRQLMKPEAVVVADYMWRRQPERLVEGGASWNDGTKRVCAAWLAIAIAYRQVGLINLFALRAALSIVNLVDRGVAVLLSRVLTEGLPGWPPLADSSVADLYQQQTAIWHGLHHRTDDADELGNPSETSGYALALMHAGRHGEALEVTERLTHRLEAGQDEGQRHDVLSAHAYALARNGRVQEALVIIAPEISKLKQLPLWGQCELLHLLGDLMHYQNKLTAAIRYFMQERALNPPALHRRLHNRSHLLRLLTATSKDADLICQIAVEGLAFASAANAPSEVDQFAETLVDKADALAEKRRERILAYFPDEISGSEPPALAIARIALRTAFAEPLDVTQRAILECQLDASGVLQGFACARLALQPNTSAPEKVRLLRSGAKANGAQSQYCAVALLDALWEAKDWHGLGEHAEQLRQTYRTYPGVHAALGASAYHEGRRNDAIEHIARTFCYASPLDVHRISPGISQLLQEAQEVSQEAQALMSSMLAQLADELQQGTDTEATILPGLSLNNVINRIYDFNKQEPSVDYQVINYLIVISERAWDRSDYPVAINARRRACQLLETTADDTGELAKELGWLATLVKQAGNVEEALSLYQRAINASGGRLAPAEQGSLLGRYANLLHQIGDYEPAVRTQWLAVIAQKQADLGPDSPFPPTLEQFVTALDPSSLDTALIPRWLPLTANIANCLESAGYNHLATRALQAFVITVTRANLEHPAVLASPTSVEATQLFENVRARLAARGIDVSAISLP